MTPEEAQVRMSLAFDYLKKEVDDITAHLQGFHTQRDAQAMAEMLRREINTAKESVLQTLSGDRRAFEDHKRDFDERRRNLDLKLDTLVTKVEFEPVKKVVFGMIGVVLLAVLTALVAMVITRGGAA